VGVVLALQSCTQGRKLCGRYFSGGGFSSGKRSPEVGALNLLAGIALIGGDFRLIVSFDAFLSPKLVSIEEVEVERRGDYL
jgi:hypothetical protein